MSKGALHGIQGLITREFENVIVTSNLPYKMGAIMYNDVFIQSRPGHGLANLTPEELMQLDTFVEQYIQQKQR